MIQHNINTSSNASGLNIAGGGFTGMTSSALPQQYQQHNQMDHRNSPVNSQFVWPPNYQTSTPVTNSSQSSNSSPLRNPLFPPGPHHNVVGLPVTSTQYRSPYAVPQSSSGSSASASFKDPGYKQQLPVSIKSVSSQSHEGFYRCYMNATKDTKMTSYL